jgi:hypothetical protein
VVRNEGDRLTRVIVSSPRKECFDVGDVASHNINEVANRERTIAQHEALGWEEHVCEWRGLPLYGGLRIYVEAKTDSIC